MLKFKSITLPPITLSEIRSWFFASIWIALIGLTALGATSSLAQETAVNGRNATTVFWGIDEEDIQYSFEQQSNGGWLQFELDSDEVVDTLQEVGRDEWTITLLSSSSGTVVGLNLWNKELTNNGTPNKSGKIVKAEADPFLAGPQPCPAGQERINNNCEIVIAATVEILSGVNAINVTVVYSGTDAKEPPTWAYRKQRDGSWLAIDQTTGEVFGPLQEVSRDQWNIHLRHGPANTNLNLLQKEITYTGHRKEKIISAAIEPIVEPPSCLEKWYKLKWQSQNSVYVCVDPDALDPITATASDVTAVSYGQKSQYGSRYFWQVEGHFYQTDTKDWEHQLKGGRFVGKWQEVSRDAASVNLVNLSGETLALNMQTKKISGTSRGGAKTAYNEPIIIASTVKGFVEKPVPPPVQFTATAKDASFFRYGDDQAYNPERTRGHFEEIFPKEWMHSYKTSDNPRDLSRAQEKYNETSRDDWSVYLKSVNGKTANLNLYTRNVTLGSGGSSRLLGRVVYVGNSEVAPRLTAAEQALIREQELNPVGYNLRSPLSKGDLNKVMRWIVGELSAESPGFCWKETYGRGGGYVSHQTCEKFNGAGNCERPDVISYPKCSPGKHGVGPVCWDICPTASQVGSHGRNLKFDCGAACALNRDECASAVTDMVFGPINLALNIATLGLNNTISSAAGAATGGAAAAPGGVTNTALSSSQWLPLLEKLSEKAALGVDVLQATGDTMDGLDWHLSRWGIYYKQNFSELVSYRINSIIDEQFLDDDARSYVKQKYAQYHLTTMLASDGWEIANQITTWASFEPTGIVAAVTAFAHPVCDFSPEPFPTVAVIEKSRRGAPDPTTISE